MMPNGGFVRGCTGKHRLDPKNKAFAQEALARMRAKEPEKAMHLYRCPSCRFLHVGTRE